MFDVLVIGGGPGGYAAAIRAAQLGAKAALCEAAELGGVCVHRGCIPSKTWAQAGHLLGQFKKAALFGITASVDGLDPAVVVARKNGVAADIGMGMQALLANNGVQVLKGRAVLKAPGLASVEGKDVQAKAIILATGASHAKCDLPGMAELAIGPDQVLNLQKLPASAFIWGGGAIECEMAGWLGAMGVQVTLACQGPRLLPGEDADLGQRLAGALKDQGVKVLTRAALASAQKQGAALRAVLGGKAEQFIDAEIIVSAERRPNTAGLGLEALGVALNADGGIKVDERMQTSAPGVFAIGDCTGGRMLSHGASYMAVIAAENAMGRQSAYDPRLVCRGLWTTPQVAAVGLGEAEAEDQGYEVETGDFPYSINGLAMLSARGEGNVKVVMEAKYGEILGLHIVGAAATELIGEASLAIQLECTAEELARGARLHPTFSETIVDAARDAMGWALYLPKR